MTEVSNISDLPTKVPTETPSPPNELDAGGHSDVKFDSVFPNDEQQMEFTTTFCFYWTANYFWLQLKTTFRKWDFGDQFPSAEVIGTDLSPCQPQWVPPNVRFEIEDASQIWTWEDNHFDFVHIRYLFGALTDWNHVFEQAYRCCAPGGWVESVEADVRLCSDDGTLDLEPVWATTTKLLEEGGKVLGRQFFVSEQQKQGIENAGFEDVKVVDYKVSMALLLQKVMLIEPLQVPVGGWPKDPAMAEVGRFMLQTLLNDPEGYSFVLWNHVLKWPEDEYQIFLMQVRKALRNRKVHSYIKVRYVYGRKPQ
ncbi:hypothetical protein FGSG_13190 [Fusarium graminearum PH-1]|uniref:hypothetical protein n=1 Tax=Gibberella zeae (strain ATCC MYA-4620 / CBS 123657 / FGSC 9075 / NRRL 31084 / PH-1) TaxID=229533 RepID=UPI00021F2351|nr:hypothetical protein FGSG_13190 [Fusarium graminearum PH-1]ESU13987.1 hypothetical protein FGSG_13190 [Fusarium graminearum PH-1]|eukprot:XP_011327494.1 hypothetical protein FGSG_13190 [Fusarium graminearum PH-1]